jgi:hypothetical protein
MKSWNKEEIEKQVKTFLYHKAEEAYTQGGRETGKREIKNRGF